MRSEEKRGEAMRSKESEKQHVSMVCVTLVSGNARTEP